MKIIAIFFMLIAGIANAQNQKYVGYDNDGNIYYGKEVLPFPKHWAFIINYTNHEKEIVFDTTIFIPAFPDFKVHTYSDGFTLIKYHTVAREGNYWYVSDELVKLKDYRFNETYTRKKALLGYFSEE